MSGRDRHGAPLRGTERRIAARGVAWGGVESAVAAMVGLLLTPIVIAHAGVAGLGLWGAAWSLAHSAGLLDLGLGATYARFASRALARGDTDALNGAVAVGTGLHLSIAAVVGGAALVGARPLLRAVAPEAEALPGAVLVVTLTILTVFLRGALSAWRGVIAGAQRTDLLGRIGAAAAIVEGTLGAACLAFGLGLAGMAGASLLVALLTTAAEAAVAHRLCAALRVRPFRARREHYREVLAFGTRLQITRAFEVIGSHAPRLILVSASGLTAAGVYDLGSRLANVAGSAAALPLRVVLPLAGHLEARNEKRRLEMLLERTTGYVALLALLPAVAILLAADLLLVAWTGHPAPPGAAATARLVVLGLAVTLVASPLRLALRALGRVTLEAVATATATLTLILLTLLLIPGHGAAGAGMAAIGAALAGAIVLLAGARRAAPSSLPAGPALAGAGRVGLAALVAFGVGAFVQAATLGPPALDRAAALFRLSLSLPASTLVFLAAAILTGALGAREAALLRDTFAKSGREARS